MLVKVLAVVTLLAIVQHGARGQLIPGCSLSAHNYVNCPAANANDPILAAFDVSRPGTVLPVPVNIQYPPSGSTVSPQPTITCIRITDKLLSGSNGVPSVQAGGVGQTSATIALKQCNIFTGVNFRVEILGR